MKAVIRADASTSIGNGHVMRCLTLAKALVNIGVDTACVCRPLPGDLISYIESQGLSVLVLPELPALPHGVSLDPEKLLPHWHQDAQECLALLAKHETPWMPMPCWIKIQDVMLPTMTPMCQPQRLST